VLFSPLLMSVRGAPQRDEALVFSSSHLYAICGLSQKMRLNWRGRYPFLNNHGLSNKIRKDIQCSTVLNHNILPGKICHVRHMFGENLMAHLQL